MQETAERILIKTITKKEPPKTLQKWASGDKWKLEPNSTYMAGCSAILNNDSEKLDSVMKVACVYNIEKSIRDFAVAYKEDISKKYSEDYIKQASEDFEKNYTKLLPEERIKFASSIPLNDSLPAKVYKSITKLAYNIKAPVEVAERGMYSKDEHRQAYHALAKTLILCRDNNERLKVAHMIEKLDKIALIDTPKYNPLEVMFRSIEKKASLNIPKDICEKALGKVLTERLYEKDGSLKEHIFNTLPKSDKDLVYKYMGKK